MREAEGENLLRIFPGPGEQAPLKGLYLREPFAPPAGRSKSFVYTNFISSLDGRISLPDPRTEKFNVPPAIGNARDWRLFQELAAGADALVISGRYVRDLPHGVSDRSFPVSGRPEYADLLRWRRARGLAPQPAVVIVTASLDLPPLSRVVASGRSVYVATGEGADPRKAAGVEAEGVRVLRAGAGKRVEGGRLIEALAREAQWNIAMIGGGEVLHALLVDDVLDRLYLTLACRMLGGLSFDTLLTGPRLEPAECFGLEALHYDAGGAESSGVEQLFAILDRRARMTTERTLA
ncbi:MAG: dihydrofolate reductase family protein [Gammaproteobacteria bacterium]|nr:dihydrofolate reductase family protein [Gammaproteobacteria bacterium]